MGKRKHVVEIPNGRVVIVLPDEKEDNDSMFVDPELQKTLDFIDDVFK